MTKEKDCSCLKESLCTLIGATILAITMFLLDSVIHGYLLMESYEETSHLWRPQEEMSGFMPFNILMYLVSAIIIVVLFKKFVLNAGKSQFFKNCIEFGLLLGAFAGVIVFGFYAYMPINFELALSWFFANLSHGVLIAFVLFSLYKKRAK